MRAVRCLKEDAHKPVPSKPPSLSLDPSRKTANLEKDLSLIAIIDDDASFREALDRLIKSYGFPTAVFPSARDFLESDCVSRTSCLISDVQMPVMSGLELQGRLGEMGRTIPIIFVSSFSDDTIQQRALQAGAVGFLGKPFDQEEMLVCIRSALERDT
jgi:FixJ family two-component response regulator